MGRYHVGCAENSVDKVGDIVFMMVVRYVLLFIITLLVTAFADKKFDFI